MSVDVTLAAEFPNDNPALHCGVIWVCLEPTGPAIAELVVRPPMEASPTIIDVVVPSGCGGERPCEDDEIVVEDMAPLEEVVETVGVIPAFDSVPPPSNLDSAPPPASEDPFTMLVCTLADVAIGAGSPHIASLLPGLLFDGRIPDALDDASANALSAGGILNGRDVTQEFIATTAAWRAILRGQSDDFSACPSMLDEWSAALLARLLGAETPRVRQELRSRGVAAFGLA